MPDTKSAFDRPLDGLLRFRGLSVSLPPVETANGAHAAGVHPLDVELVRAMARGDRDGLGGLYDRYAALLCGVGIRLLGDRREAEDLVHDVYLEAWHKASSYDSTRGTVRSWLLLRMRSRCLDRRKSAGERRVDRVGDVESFDRHDGELDDGGTYGGDRERVRQVLDRLPPEQREVLELCYVAGLSGSEASSRLGVPLGTVKSRVAAALGKLRTELRVEHE